MAFPLAVEERVHRDRIVGERVQPERLSRAMRGDVTIALTRVGIELDELRLRIQQDQVGDSRAAVDLLADAAIEGACRGRGHFCDNLRYAEEEAILDQAL